MHTNQITSWRTQLLEAAAEAFNSDHGSQLTSKAFTDLLKSHKNDFSMDVKRA